MTELSRHACAAIPLGEPTAAIAYARRAGELAMASLAFDEAATHFRRALRVVELSRPADQLVRCQLMARLGAALIEANHAEASTVLERAAHEARRLADDDLLATIAWALSPYGLTVGSYNPLVVSLAQEALDRAASEPTVTRARLLIVLAAHAEGLEDPERRYALADEALTTARLAGDEVTLGEVLASYQFTSSNPDNLTDRIAAASELFALASRLDQRTFLLFALHGRYWNSLEQGDVAAALAASSAFEQAVAGRHDTFSQIGVLARRATNLFLAGQLELAEHAGDELLAVATELAEARGLDPLNEYGPLLMGIRYNQGRIGELIPFIQLAAQAHPGVPAYEAVLALAQARSGQHDTAQALLRRLVSNNLRAIPRHVQWYSAMMCLADTAHLTGDRAAAKLLADKLEPYAGRLAVHDAGVSSPIDLARANSPSHAATPNEAQRSPPQPPRPAAAPTRQSSSVAHWSRKPQHE